MCVYNLCMKNSHIVRGHEMMWKNNLLWRGVSVRAWVKANAIIWMRLHSDKESVSAWVFVASGSSLPLLASFLLRNGNERHFGNGEVVSCNSSLEQSVVQTNDGVIDLMLSPEFDAVFGCFRAYRYIVLLMFTWMWGNVRWVEAFALTLVIFFTPKAAFVGLRKS